MLTAFLFVSPVVYAGLKLKESATPVETQIVSAPAPTSIQPLIIESTLGQPKKSILNTSQAEITSSSITSSSKADSSSQSTISSQANSSSSTVSSIALKINSLISVGITSANLSSISKTEKTEKQPTKNQSSILAQKTQSSDQLLQPTESTITETKTIVEEVKVDPISVSSVISNSSQNTFPPVSIVESDKAIESKSSPKVESKLEVKAQSSVPTQAESKPTTYNGLIDYYCGQYGCNPVQLKRVIMCESTNNPNARNGIYSGLFQFSPATFRSYSTKMGLVNANIWDAEDQINVASWMFANGQARQWSCK